MPTGNVTATAQATVAGVLKTYAELLRSAVYHRGSGSSPMSCKMLVLPLPAALLFGNKIDANDEQIFIAAADLAAVQPLQPGDTIDETGMTRTVITAHLDSTGTVWEFVARRTFT